MSIEEKELEEKQLQSNYSLGELPRDLLRERKIICKPDKKYYENDPADIASTVDLNNQPTELEGRTQAASVRSVYDTRPINGTDFQYAETLTGNTTLELPLTLDFNYIVPQSYIAVLRDFEIRQFPLFIGSNLQPLTSVLVDGIAQISHSNLPYNPDNGKVVTHILANEKSTITVRMYYPATYAEDVTLNVFCKMHGNLLLTNNLPLPFEIGNQLPAKTVPVPKSVNDVKPIQKPVVKPKPKPKTKRKPELKFSYNVPDRKAKTSSGRVFIPGKK